MLTVTLVQEKETKNTIRFQEQVPPGGEPILRTVYLSKQAHAALDNCRTIKVVVAPGQGGPAPVVDTPVAPT